MRGIFITSCPTYTICTKLATDCDPRQDIINCPQNLTRSRKGRENEISLSLLLKIFLPASAEYAAN